MAVPQELFYAKTHEWVSLNEGIATVGITDFAQSQLSDLTFVELPEVGVEFAAGDEAAVVESVKAAADVYAPVAGEVIEINPELEPAISGLGTVLVITGRSGETIDFLQKHLNEDSEASSSIMIALSRAYVSQGDHAKALAILEKAEKVAPGHPELEQELAKYRD